MKKKLPMIIGLIAVIAFSIFYGFTDKAHKIYDNNVNTAVYTDLGQLADGQVLLQAFTSEENVLDGLLIKCNRSGDYANAVVNIEILDSKTNKVLATASDVGSNIAPRKLHLFKFDKPLTDCKGTEFLLRITEDNSTVGNGIDLYYQPHPEMTSGFSSNGSPVAGVLVMKTVTHRFDIETFIIMFVSIMFIWGFMYFLYRLFK